jgi:WD40 repeat protein
MKKKIISLFAGSIFLSYLTNGLDLPKSSAQENLPLSVAQSSSSIQVQDITGFKGVIVTVGASPDGETLIVASNDGQITAIDTKTLESKYSISSRVNPYSDIAFTSDGKLFAVCSEQDTIVYETETGTIVRTLQESTANVSDVAINPDNTLLVTVSGEDRTIKVWDLEQGQLRQNIGKDVTAVTSVAFDPNNKLFVTGSIGTDRVIQFWDAETFALLDTSPKQPGFVNSVSFTSDGTKLVAAVRNFIKVWDVNTKQEILSLKGPQLELNKIAVSPDNRLVATANREGTIMIIDIIQGKILSTLEGHQGWVQSVTFSPDGQTLYSGAEDKIVKVWDVSQF